MTKVRIFCFHIYKQIVTPYQTVVSAKDVAHPIQSTDNFTSDPWDIISADRTLKPQRVAAFTF